MAHTPVFLRSVVVAADRLSAIDQADDEGYEDDVDLSDDARHGDRRIRAVDRLLAVGTKHIIQGDLH